MIKTNKTMLLAMLGIGLAVSSTQANSVTFADYAGTFPYSENGFTVTPTATPNAGAWGITAANTIGAAITLNPGVNPLSPPHGIISVTRNDGGLFYFNSLSVGGFNTASTPGAAFDGYLFFVYGLLNGKVVLDSFLNTTSLGGTGYHDYLADAVVHAGDYSAQMDTLIISGSYYQATKGTSPDYSVNGIISFKNIDVTAATSTPDAASTLALSGLSALALFFFGRKYQTVKLSQP